MGGGELPEDVGKDAALLLLDEMAKGGVIDRSHQSLIIQMMVLGSEDICKVRVGRQLTPTAIETLRIMKDSFGTVFKIRRQESDGSVVMMPSSSSSSSMKEDTNNGDFDDDGDEEEEDGEGETISANRGIIYNEMTHKEKSSSSTTSGVVEVINSKKDKGKGKGEEKGKEKELVDMGIGFDRSGRKFTDETDTILLSCLGSGFVNMSRKIRLTLFFFVVHTIRLYFTLIWHHVYFT